MPDLPAVELPGSWTSRYNGSGAGDDFPLDLALGPNGSTVYVTGRSVGSGSTFDFSTLAYDARTGTQLWEARYDAGDYDASLDITVSPEGDRVYVTGPSVGISSGYDYATAAYDALTGAEIWVSRFSDTAASDDKASALALSPDGTRLYVTGESFNDYMTVAYSAAGGDQLWASRYTGAPGSEGGARALQVSPDGSRVFVTGYDWRFSASHADYATVAYVAASGTLAWSARYTGVNSYDVPNAMAISPDGRTVFVSGQGHGAVNGSPSDYATLAYDAAGGTQLWARRFNGGGDDVANTLAISPDGTRVFVAGDSFLAGAYDYATVAYLSATGTQLWMSRYNGPGAGQDLAQDLVVGPGGERVYVTGPSVGVGGEYDYATVGYLAASGSQLWESRYVGTGGGHDVSLDLAVSPNGTSLFISGFSLGVGTGYDYVTLARCVGLLVVNCPSL